MIPFGLINTAANFQRFINKIFAKKLDIFVIMYLENILIFFYNDGNDYIVAV